MEKRLMMARTIYFYVIACLLLTGCVASLSDKNNDGYRPTLISKLLEYPDDSAIQAESVDQGKLAASTQESVVGKSESILERGPTFAAVVDKVVPGDSSGNSESKLIQPGDKLEIGVYGVPELSRIEEVSSQGTIEMTLIGVLDAAGKTDLELKSDIEKLYGRDYLQSPDVSISVIGKAKPRPITVGGAVQSSGIFDVAYPISLLQSVARGGGFSELASTSSVLVFRTVNRKKFVAKFDIVQIGKGEQPDPEILPGDTVYIDYSDTRLAIRDIKSVIPITSVFLPLALLLR
jgi:polysaccharide biosynthesis/export protein